MLTNPDHGGTLTAYQKNTISQRADGQYHRTVGKMQRPDGSLAPKRFLLGSDLTRARLANTLLQSVWRAVCDHHEVEKEWRVAFIRSGETLLNTPEDPRPLTLDEVSSEPPHWDEESLLFANAARRGSTSVLVPRGPNEEAVEFAERLAGLATRFANFRVEPAESDRQAASAGKASLAGNAEWLMDQAHEASRKLQPSTGRLSGHPLHTAIDSYADQCDTSREGGKVEAANARRLKESVSDRDLSEFGFSALQEIGDYWRSRPASKNTGKPIAVTTVDNHLSTARRFIRWLDSTDQYEWEMPKNGLETLKVNIQRLQTPQERAERAKGVKVFSVDHLSIIWRHTTDFERLLIVLSLNAGLAQAELISLSWDEIDEEAGTIKRIRSKSSVYAEFSLWDESLRALGWWQRVRPRSSNLVLVSENNNAYTRQRISNSWTRLKKRIENQTGSAPTWWLPFKHLRKTAAQMVRNVASGEVAGVFLSHGSPVGSDELSDLYSNRPFDKVFSALDTVEQRLQPVFNVVDSAFTSDQVGTRAQTT